MLGLTLHLSGEQMQRLINSLFIVIFKCSYFLVKKITKIIISAQERLGVVSKQKEIYRYRYQKWVEKYRKKSSIVHPQPFVMFAVIKPLEHEFCVCDRKQRWWNDCRRVDRNRKTGQRRKQKIRAKPRSGPDPERIQRRRATRAQRCLVRKKLLWKPAKLSQNPSRRQTIKQP